MGYGDVCQPVCQRAWGTFISRREICVVRAHAPIYDMC